MFCSPVVNPAANKGAVMRISDFTTNAVHTSFLSSSHGTRYSRAWNICLCMLNILPGGGWCNCLGGEARNAL